MEPLQDCRRDLVKSGQRVGLNGADGESSTEDVCHSVAVHVIAEDGREKMGQEDADEMVLR